MATLIAYQDGNFTGATTFKAIATGTGAQQTTLSTTTNVNSSTYQYSPTFTLTNGEVIEGVLMRCFRGSNSLGTITVGLSDDNGVTAVREVTVNATDLPLQFVDSYLFFKFNTPLTADGGNDYRLGIKTTSANNGTFWRSAVAGNQDWFRLFRKSDTATIATTDVVYISGERTGAGSVTNVTVTMDSTANTSYGAMNIGDAGTVSFGTSASTNYYLRLAGNLNVWGNGTLNIGTSGTRIPSTSTATLEFNCSSNVQFGLEAQNGSTVNIYGAEKANTKVLLTADAASGQAVITVQDTTGWANNDELVIAATTESITQTEKRTISSIGSSTQATMTANLSASHSGTAPFQGGVLNITRNVKVRGTSGTLQSYINCASTSNFTADYAEFFFLGSNTTNKRGIETATNNITGTFKMTFCSVHDHNVANSLGIAVSATNANLDVRDCVVALTNSTSIYQRLTTGVPEIHRNWLANTNSGGILLEDAGGNVTDNFVQCGSPGVGIRVTETNGIIGTFSGNVAYGNNAQGIQILGAGGAISNCKAWRTQTGFDIGGTGTTATSCDSRNNSASNFQITSNHRLVDCVAEGTATRHVLLNGLNTVFENCDFGQTTTATNFITANAQNVSAIFRNCDIAETLTPVSQTNLTTSQSKIVSVIAFDKLNSTSGNHRAYKQFGYAGSDQSVYRTASPSEVLVPNSASGKLPSGSKKFGVASGNSATVSVWVRKSSTYNGAEPRLILKRNIVGGVSSDQVLDTASGANETWLELTASTPTVTDDCVLEVYVDCDGTAGTVNVDDYSIS